MRLNRCVLVACATVLMALSSSAVFELGVAAVMTNMRAARILRVEVLD